MESFILKIDHFQISSNIIHISDIKKKKKENFCVTICPNKTNL